MNEETFKKILEIIKTHDEGDGAYCDTGEDMDWTCRSECVNKAVERLEWAFTRGYI